MAECSAHHNNLQYVAVDVIVVIKMVLERYSKNVVQMSGWKENVDVTCCYCGI